RRPPAPSGLQPSCSQVAAGHLISFLFISEGKDARSLPSPVRGGAQILDMARRRTNIRYAGGFIIPLRPPFVFRAVFPARAGSGACRAAPDMGLLADAAQGRANGSSNVSAKCARLKKKGRSQEG